eukprot:gene6037-6275_t
MSVPAAENVCSPPPPRKASCWDRKGMMNMTEMGNITDTAGNVTAGGNVTEGMNMTAAGNETEAGAANATTAELPTANVTTAGP